MRRAGPIARPFSPSSSLPPATADALAASPLSTPPLAPTEFLRQNPPPDFPSRSNPPPFRFLPRSFQDFPFLQSSQSEPTFRFTLFDPFSQLLLSFHPSVFFFFLFFFYVISLQSSTLSLFLFLLILRFIDRRIFLHHEISRRLRNFIYPRNFFLFTFLL